jgi:hypothetical protein
MKLRPAETMTAVVTSFVMGACQEFNPWWCGDDDKDDD